MKIPNWVAWHLTAEHADGEVKLNTVDEVERITGYDFFPALPDGIEDVVEARADIKEW